MKKAGTIFIYLSLAVLILWLVPWLYNLATLETYSSPFTLYSPVIHDFTYLDRGDGRDFNFIDRQGGVHGDEVQPLFYSSVLVSKGTFPDSLNGRAITPEDADLHSTILTARPVEIVKKDVPVRLLMESVPVRLELQDSEEAMVFRKHGISIYRMEGNEFLKDKSEKLTADLSGLGFKFPVRLSAGNPSHRKAYDEGYLLTDSEDKLYHVKQVNGNILCEYFPQADGLSLKHLMITEFEDHKTLGFLVTGDGFLAVLFTDGKVVRTAVPYDPAKEHLMVVGDMFYQTIKIHDNEKERFYALDSEDFSMVDSMDRTYPIEDGVNLCKYIFPCRIHFTSSNDGFVKMRFKDFSWIGLAVDILVAGAIILVRRRRRRV